MVAEPEAIMLVGLNDPQVRLGGAVTLRVTVPVNPLIAAIVTVEVGDWPALTAAGDVALMVKSWNRRTTVAECSRDPLEPVIVSVWLPAMLALHDTVAVPDPVTLVGVIAPHVSPTGTVSVRLTMPLKWFSAVMVIVEITD
jgi:hypothetical protein